MEDIGRAVERLLIDESLTADVDDTAAKALLRWGEEQLQAGRPEEQVRQGIRALNKVISKRAALDPAAACARLESGGLAAADAALAGLWAETLPEGEWAEKLIGALVLVPLSSTPIVATPIDHDKETRRQGDKGTWWQRLFRRGRP